MPQYIVYLICPGYYIEDFQSIILPIRGTASEVLGKSSDTIKMKTEYDKSSVRPIPIFSPESGGSLPKVEWSATFISKLPEQYIKMHMAILYILLKYDISNINSAVVMYRWE